MRATALEFRLRMLINAAIIFLGIWSPWIAWDRRVGLLEWLPLQVARTGLLPFSSAVDVLIAIAALVAAIGAWQRVWGTACLGPSTVIHPQMKAGAVVANGPYRYVRNPLYIGVWCMVAAITLLMPPSGAALCMVLLTFFLVRLTLGEEAFLTSQLGESYRAYLSAVPRFLPRLRSPLPRGTSQPNWTVALLAELTPIGVFVAVVTLAWSYSAVLMGRVILVGFGLSLIARVIMVRPVKKPVTPE